MDTIQGSKTATMFRLLREKDFVEIVLPCLALSCLVLPTALTYEKVMIEAASSEEQKTPEYRTRKLESLTRQNELIEEENKKREEAKQAQVRHVMRVN